MMWRINSQEVCTFKTGTMHGIKSLAASLSQWMLSYPTCKSENYGTVKAFICIYIAASSISPMNSCMFTHPLHFTASSSAGSLLVYTVSVSISLLFNPWCILSIYIVWSIAWFATCYGYHSVLAQHICCCAQYLKSNYYLGNWHTLFHHCRHLYGIKLCVAET
jgi:hypothetical protein